MSNEKVITVLGVLIDPALSCGMTVEHGESTVHNIVKSLWATLVNQLNKDSTSEIADCPAGTDIFSGEIDSSAAFIDRPDREIISGLKLTDPTNSTLDSLATASSTETYLVAFMMPNQWAYVGELSKQNKENLVTGMTNLSINENQGRGKLAASLHKLNGE
jgi:hypothetical protein